MKKFLSALVAVIILSTFVTAQAAEYKGVHTYAYSKNGVDYYVETVIEKGIKMEVMVPGYKNDKVISSGWMFTFIYDNLKKDVYYDILNIFHNDGSGDVESGYLSDKKNLNAVAVFEIASKVAGH